MKSVTKKMIVTKVNTKCWPTNKFIRDARNKTIKELCQVLIKEEWVKMASACAIYHARKEGIKELNSDDILKLVDLIAGAKLPLNTKDEIKHRIDGFTIEKKPGRDGFILESDKFILGDEEIKTALKQWFKEHGAFSAKDILVEDILDLSSQKRTEELVQ